MHGGSFTIVRLAESGHVPFTPIINGPEVFRGLPPGLGVCGGARPRNSVYWIASVCIRLPVLWMPASVSYDHQRHRRRRGGALRGCVSQKLSVDVKALL